jgi:DNA-binding transcriptional regulator LsrR (DeoR family)
MNQLSKAVKSSLAGGMTQQELSDYLEISCCTLSSLLHGSRQWYNPASSSLLYDRLADHLAVTKAEVLAMAFDCADDLTVTKTGHPTIDRLINNKHHKGVLEIAEAAAKAYVTEVLEKRWVG